MKKLDSRQFTKKSYTALKEIESKLHKDYYKKASGLIQGLAVYISTWGLHRLSGDAVKFSNGKGEDTKYKGKVYFDFLQALKDFSQQQFDVRDPSTLINMPLSEYTALNRLAIELAREWSFWAPAILGEAEES